MKPFNRDVFNSERKRPVANATFALLNANQDEPAERQVMAACCLCLILCDHFKLDAQDVFSAARRLMEVTDRVRPEFHAVRQYLEEELT